MGINLNKGQSISLAKSAPSSLSRVKMGLGWDARKVRGFFGTMKEQAIDLDASCLVFDAAGTLIDQVWFRQLRSKDGAIQHTGDNTTGDGDGDDESIIVELSKVEPTASHLVFVVSSYSGESFSQIDNAFCRLVDDSTQEELARYELSGSGSHTAQVMSKLSRGDDGWQMTAVGERANGRTILDLEAVARSTL